MNLMLKLPALTKFHRKTPEQMQLLRPQWTISEYFLYDDPNSLFISYSCFNEYSQAGERSSTRSCQRTGTWWLGSIERPEEKTRPSKWWTSPVQVLLSMETNRSPHREDEKKMWQYWHTVQRGLARLQLSGVLRETQCHHRGISDGTWTTAMAHIQTPWMVWPARFNVFSFCDFIPYSWKKLFPFHSKRFPSDDTLNYSWLANEE